MSATTGIEWTDATWNPVTGCDEVSRGCDRCYAKTFAERFRGVEGHYFEQGFDVVLRPDKLKLPLTWRKPKKVFVNSMSDLFHKDVPDEYIAKVFAVMAATPQHTYQLLTKRHGRMRSLVGNDGQTLLEATQDEATAQAIYDAPWPLPNVWLGVSVEDQQRADLRIPALLGTQAAVRFLSCEPLLGPLDLARHMPAVDYWDWRETEEWGIHWVIAGGESGHGARPMHPDWARKLRDQCVEAGVAFHFKQWGEWAPAGLGIGMARHNVGSEVLVGDAVDDMGHRQVMRRVGKKAAGRLLDDCAWDQFPGAFGQEEVA